MAARTIRLLIVEDSKSDAALLLHQLSRQGFNAVNEIVDNAEAMSAALNKQIWDIIISDYILPGFSGLDALKLLQDRGLDIPCIITSGRIDDETAVAAMRAGAKDYIMKDNLKRLGPAIERELRDAEVRRERRKTEEALKQNEAELIKSQQRQAMAIQASGAGVFEYRITPEFNYYIDERLADILGYKLAELPKPDKFLYWLMAQIHPNDLNSVLDIYDKFSQDPGKKYTAEFRIKRKSGEWIYIRCISLASASDINSPSLQISGIVLDITESKQIEKRTLLSNETMQLFWKVSSRQEYLQKAVKLIHDWSECECVGIRIVDPENQSIPYAAYIGFGDTFLKSENSLSLKSDQCSCIRVISNSPDFQDSGAMTSSGSFFLTNSLDFISNLTQEQQTRYRGVCIRCGYQTFAIVPIRHNQAILGAIHVADREIAALSSKEIETLESMATLIGQGVYRFDIQDELRESEARLGEAQSIAHLGNWDWDMRTNKLLWSDEIYRIFGRSPQEFGATYDAFLSYVHPDDRASVTAAVKTAVDERKLYNVEHRIVLPDGVVRVVHEQGIVNYDEDNQPLRMIGVVQDITRLKRAEDDLRALSRRLVEVQENERRAIARELHDEIGQSLTALKILVSQAARLPADKNQSNLLEAQSLVSDLLKQVRQMSLDLRPSMLDDLGLLPTLLWHFERFTSQTGIQIKFEHKGIQKSLPPEVNTTVYRVIQEALTNVARYAGVKEATVTVHLNSAKLVIRVEDEGQGFIMADLDSNRSTGLSGMRERVLLLDGKLTLDASPGLGTRIVVELPVLDAE